jgi:hypothetical protein
LTIALDDRGSDRAPYRGHQAADGVEKGGTRVLQEMPTVGDLQHLGADPGHRLAVAAATVASDDRDLRMGSEPSIQGGRLTVRQEIDDPVALQVAD